MNSTVADAIAFSTSELTSLVVTPTGDLGYGTDLSCTSDIHEDMSEVDPTSITGIIESIIRRLTTSRGSLQDDPDYGVNITSFLNRGTSAVDLLNMSGEIRNEIAKDDRIDSVVVSVVIPALNQLSINIGGRAVEIEDGSFSLILAVTSGSVIVEAIS